MPIKTRHVNIIMLSQDWSTQSPPFEHRPTTAWVDRTNTRTGRSYPKLTDASAKRLERLAESATVRLAVSVTTHALHLFIRPLQSQAVLHILGALKE